MSFTNLPVTWRYRVGEVFHTFEAPDRLAFELGEVLAGHYSTAGAVVPDCPVILDIGANVGAYSCYAALTYPGATIHAYEPDPANCRLWETNVDALWLDNPQPTLHPVAVSEAAGTALLYPGKVTCGQNSLVDRGDQQLDKGFLVDTVAASALPRADVLKIDTEGSEVTILKGYPYLHQVSVVHVEWHRADDKWRVGGLLAKAGLHLLRETQAHLHCGELTFARKDC